MTNAASSKHPPFSVTRTFDAPRDLVYRACTEREHLFHWWGPKGYEMLTCEIDLRPGGLFRYGMRAPNGAEMWGLWVFREIVPQERIVFVVSFTDAEGRIIRHPLAATWPLEVLSTLEFTEQDGKTTITNTGGPINATPEEEATYAGAHAGMKQGFKGTYDQLDAYLASVKAR